MIVVAWDNGEPGQGQHEKVNNSLKQLFCSSLLIWTWKLAQTATRAAQIWEIFKLITSIILIFILGWWLWVALLAHWLQIFESKWRVVLEATIDTPLWDWTSINQGHYHVIAVWVFFYNLIKYLIALLSCERGQIISWSHDKSQCRNCDKIFIAASHSNSSDIKQKRSIFDCDSSPGSPNVCLSVYMYVTLATAVLQLTTADLDFWRTSEGLPKDFQRTLDFMVYKSQPPCLRDLLCRHGAVTIAARLNTIIIGLWNSADRVFFIAKTFYCWSMNELELLIIARKKIRQKNQWSVWSRVSVNTNLVLMTVKSVAESCSHDNILNFDNVVFKRSFLEY